MSVREVSELDLRRLAKGIYAVLSDVPLPELDAAIAGLDSVKDLGPCGQAAIALRGYLSSRRTVRKAGWRG